jgi:hypothetical protein
VPASDHDSESDPRSPHRGGSWGLSSFTASGRLRPLSTPSDSLAGSESGPDSESGRHGHWHRASGVGGVDPSPALAPRTGSDPGVRRPEYRPRPRRGRAGRLGGPHGTGRLATVAAAYAAASESVSLPLSEPELVMPKSR